MSDGIPADLIATVRALHAEWWGEISRPLALAIGRKVAEEATEVAMAVVSAVETDDPLAGEELVSEIGDVLFAAIAACRIVDVDPAKALRAAVLRNEERWRVD